VSGRLFVGQLLVAQHWKTGYCPHRNRAGRSLEEGFEFISCLEAAIADFRPTMVDGLMS